MFTNNNQFVFYYSFLNTGDDNNGSDGDIKCSDGGSCGCNDYGNNVVTGIVGESKGYCGYDVDGGDDGSDVDINGDDDANHGIMVRTKLFVVMIQKGVVMIMLMMVVM